MQSQPRASPVPVPSSMLTSACVTQFAASPVAIFSAYDRRATELDAMFPTAPQYNGGYGAGTDPSEYTYGFALNNFSPAPAPLTTSTYIAEFAPPPADKFTAYGRNDAELSAWYVADYNKWSDPFSERPTSAYLTGVHPGELIHARGTTEYSGFRPDEPVRLEAGDQISQISQEGDLNYFDNSSLTHAKSILVVLACQVLLTGAVQAYHANQAVPASEGLKLRPGGPFDPLGLAEAPHSPTELKAKESRNGRLAIISMLAYAVQIIVPGEGPARNWAACAAHAPGANDLSLVLMGQVTPSRVAMFAACGHNAAEFSAWYGSDCSEWLDPERPTCVYLIGVYLGDCRWGTADLGADRITLEQYRKAELIHARWALLDIKGCSAPEILANITGSQLSGPACFQTGVEISQEGSSNPSLIHATPIFAVLTCRALLQGAADAHHANQAGRASEDPGLLHGSTFNPLGLADGPDSLAEFKEVQKRRLAMFSMLGFSVQAIVTSEGPVGSWATHVADVFSSYSLSLALMDQVDASFEAMLAACDRVSDNLTAWYRPERNEWLSPSPDISAPYYLTGEFPGNPSCLAAMASVQQTQGPFHMPPDHAPVPVPVVFQCAAAHGLAPLLGAAGTSLASGHCTGELSPPPPLGSRPLGHIWHPPLGLYLLPLAKIWTLWQPGTILSTTRNQPLSRLGVMPRRMGPMMHMETWWMLTVCPFPFQQCRETRVQQATTSHH